VIPDGLLLVMDGPFGDPFGDPLLFLSTASLPTCRPRRVVTCAAWLGSGSVAGCEMASEGLGSTMFTPRFSLGRKPQHRGAAPSSATGAGRAWCPRISAFGPRAPQPGDTAPPASSLGSTRRCQPHQRRGSPVGTRTGRSRVELVSKPLPSKPSPASSLGPSAHLLSLLVLVSWTCLRACQLLRTSSRVLA
jgi:hypothetical protein